MTTTTYDGSGEAVHPDVYDAGAGGWNGHRYWMVMTPYPAHNTAFENPSILVSSDKTTWALPDGLTNPIVPAPGSGNYSDPDITMVDETMYVLFRHNTLLKETHSTDGVTWTEPATLINFVSGTALLSQAVVWDGSQYLMFSVNADAHPYTVERRTCATLTGTWSGPVTVSFPTPEPWHIDVIAVAGTLHAFVSTVDYRGWYAESTDNGLNWTAGVSSILRRGTVGVWDETIYRGSILKTVTGFDLWYSAFNTADQWHIGYTTIA